MFKKARGSERNKHTEDFKTKKYIKRFAGARVSEILVTNVYIRSASPKAALLVNYSEYLSVIINGASQTAMQGTGEKRQDWKERGTNRGEGNTSEKGALQPSK